MQALVKFFGRIVIILLSVAGLAVWLGVTGVLAYQGVLRFLEGEAASEKIGGAVMAAGIVLAFVGAVLVLRITNKLIPAIICAVAGAFAFFSGGQLNPVQVAQESPTVLAIATTVFLVPLGIMFFTRKWAPFLVTLGLLGIAGIGAGLFLGVGDMMGPKAIEAAAPPTQEEAAVDATPSPVEPPVTEQPAAEAAAPPPAMATAPPPPTIAPVTPTPAPRDDLASSADAGAAAGGAAAGASGSGQMRTRSLRPPQAAPAPPPPAMAEAEPPAAAMEAAPPPAAAAPNTVAAAPPAAEPKAADFQVGKLRFNKPESMRIQQTYTVEATIAGERATTPQVSLGDVGSTQSRDVQITRKVRVELIAAPTDFEIKKIHTVDTVLVTPETAGQWSWEVKPLKAGLERPMLLQVFGVIEKDGVVEGETPIETHRETINVEVTPMDQVRLFSADIVTNWEPVVGALGVLGGAWAFFSSFLAGLRRKKEEAA